VFDQYFCLSFLFAGIPIRFEFVSAGNHGPGKGFDLMDPIGIGRNYDFVFYVGGNFKIDISPFRFHRENFGGDKNGRSLSDLFHRNSLRQIAGRYHYLSTARFHFGIFLYGNNQTVPRFNGTQPICRFRLNGKGPGIHIGDYTYGALGFPGIKRQAFFLYG
jgi:hypothetical protein